MLRLEAQGTSTTVMTTMKARRMSGGRMLRAMALIAPAVAFAASCKKQEEVEQPATTGTVQEAAIQPAAADTQALEGVTQLYWGDAHLHTSKSIDAYLMGNWRLSLDDAYRFARGEEVVTHSGEKARLARPLDFLVVADHAEYLGGLELAAQNDPKLLATPVGKAWAAITERVRRGEIVGAGAGTTQGAMADMPVDLRRSVWEEVIRAADRYNEPGRFTAFSGYEWSASPDGGNLHRVVVFKDGADKVGQILPLSSFDSADPADLWKALAEYERRTGGEVIAIPHNSNLSNGRMFIPQTFDGAPITPDYAEQRARWEPIVEVTQSKGDSETHPILSPTDEFADFERWDEGNVLGTAKKEPWMLQYEYAREVLKQGLELEEKLGANPFKFGMIGGTDSHTSLSTHTEDNFWGKWTTEEPARRHLDETLGFLERPTWKLSASGLAAVWAEANTREAIFAAFKRREVYATSGPRIRVRFFGGYEYTEADLHSPELVRRGYEKGVPMGGDLPPSSGRRPTFLVVAAKDPDGANLDRIQIIKGWLDREGKLHEKIYDVALSDGRQVDPKTGKAPAIHSTVNVSLAEYSNSVGAAELAALWVDPDFGPEQRAFYYVRVIEIPTPRWTAYDARRRGVKLDPQIPVVVQDRAYTSPIWYRP